MSFGISFIINDDGSIEMLGKNQIKINREKGNNLIELPINYTVIDIETTGLDPRFDEIIEIGAIKIKNNNIVEKFESLVKPNGYYIYDDEDDEIEYFSYVSDFITELTGITNEMLESAPDITKVLPSFIDFIGNDILLGHNVHFDINFLYDSLIEISGIKLSNDFVDLMRLARKVYPDFENHKLITIASNLGINPEGAHRSLIDCLITHKCFQLLSKKVDFDILKLKSLWKYHKGKSLDLTTVAPTTTKFNENHLLYNMNCVFTGKLERMARKDAAQLVVNLGGKCLNSVTKQTNFLILGNFEYNATVKDGKSSKLKKAEKLILEGQDLQILSENVFYDLINNE